MGTASLATLPVSRPHGQRRRSVWEPLSLSLEGEDSGLVFLEVKMEVWMLGEPTSSCKHVNAACGGLGWLQIVTGSRGRV